MENKKTTVAGLVKIVTLSAGVGGMTLTPEMKELIIVGCGLLYGAADMVQGYFTKDS